MDAKPNIPGIKACHYRCTGWSNISFDEVRVREVGRGSELHYDVELWYESSAQYEELDQDVHDWDEGEITTPATCARKGIKTYTCKNDSKHTYTEEVEIDKDAHDLVDHPAQEATCTDIGWEAYQTCSRCDYTTYAEKPAKGHDYIDHSAQEPTCTAIGWDAYRTCSRCNYSTYAEKPAKGHVTGGSVKENETAATCTGTGSYDLVIHCEDCGKELSRETFEISSTGHDHRLIGQSITILTWQCSRYGDSYWEYNTRSSNELDGLVRDGNGEYLDYTAGVTYLDGERVLKVVPDQQDLEETGLYLAPENVKLWMKQGIRSVILATDAGELWVKLEDVPAIAFIPETEPETYVFSIVAGEDGAAIKVEALTGEEKTTVETFEGVELK